MPGTNAVGMKTAAKNQGDGNDRARHLFHRLLRGIVRGHPLLDVVLDRLHHDDGIVHHQSDGQHQAEERKRVDGKSENRKYDECADQRDRNRQQRDQRGAPALQEDVDHQNDQCQRFEQGLPDLVEFRR